MEIQPTQTPVKNTESGSRTVVYSRYSLLLFVVFVLVETLMLRQSFLWKIQELDLFTLSGFYLSETLSHTGGVLRYASSFLTQFFFYPWLGSLLYLMLLIVLSRLTASAFNLKKHLLPFSFIPALAVLLTLTELGYEVLGLNVQGYAFVVPLGVSILLTGFLWYRRLLNNQQQSGFLFIWTLLAYPLIGAYALMGTLLMLLFNVRMWDSQQGKWKWMPILIGLASLFMLPLLINNTLFSSGSSDCAFTALLPHFPSGKSHLWLPYIMLTVTLLILSFTFPIKSIGVTSTYQHQASAVLFIATLLMVHVCGYRDNAFHTELNMERAYTSDNWQEVLKLSQQLGKRTNDVTTTYTNLSRLNLGLMDKPTHVTSSPFSGALIYYEYGDAENALKWSMKQAAQYGMSIYVLKYLTLSAQATDNIELAVKYNDILKGSLFHRKWAMEQATQIEHAVNPTPLP